MTQIELLAENILMNAAKSNDGSCYPSQISSGKTEVYDALELLEIYGKTFPMTGGAMPIFTINELGKHFASTGAWSGKERVEILATERHKEQMGAQKTNNQLVKWNMVITVVMGLLSVLVPILIALFL